MFDNVSGGDGSIRVDTAPSGSAASLLVESERRRLSAERNTGMEGIKSEAYLPSLLCCIPAGEKEI